MRSGRPGPATPSRTQSQIKLVPEEAAGAAEPVAGAVGADVTVAV